MEHGMYTGGGARGFSDETLQYLQQLQENIDSAMENEQGISLLQNLFETAYIPAFILDQQNKITFVSSHLHNLIAADSDPADIYELEQLLFCSDTDLSLTDAVKDESRQVLNTAFCMEDRSGARKHTLPAALLFIRTKSFTVGILRRSYSDGPPPTITTEEKIASLLNQFNATQHSSKTGSWYYDFGTDFLWFSENMYKLFGLDPAYGPLRSISRFIERVDEEDRQKIIEHEEGINDLEETVLDYGFTKVNNNEHVFLRSEIKMTRDKDGNPLRLTGIVTDTTEQKRLEKISAMNTFIVQNAMDAIVTTDLEFRLQTSNAASQRLFGRNAEEFLGKNVLEFAEAEFPGSSLEQVVHTISTTGKWSGELTATNSAGDRLSLASNISLLIDDTGRPFGFIGVLRDITNEKQLNARLQFNETLFKSFMAEMPELAAIKDENGKYVFINKRYRQIIAHLKNEKILTEDAGGMGVTETTGSPQSKAVEEIDRRVIAEQRTFQFENFKMEINGKTFYSNLIKFPLTGLNGERLVGTLSIDRTKEQVYLKELEEAKQRAESANTLKTNILQNLSHEFRTPLTGVLGYAAMLKNHSDEKVSKYGARIAESADRLKKTMDNLLDLSFLTVDDYTVKHEEISSEEIFREVINRNKSEAARKAIIIETVAHNKEESFYQDRSIICDIIDQLVDNALKFTVDGRRIKVESSVEKSDEGQKLMLFKVTDEGVGIPEHYLPKIFDEFDQLSTGLSRSHEGMGIGLALAKKKCRLIGGSLTVESTPGEGSVFTLTVPMNEPNAAAPPLVEPHSRQPLQEEDQSAPDKKLTILLVDDNPIIYDVISDIYLSETANVEYATNGEDALEMFRRTKFDLVIMDINLRSEPDGSATMKRMHEIDGPDTPPIIAFTGYANLNDKDKFLGEGFDGYLAKPVTEKALLQLINELV